MMGAANRGRFSMWYIEATSMYIVRSTSARSEAADGTKAVHVNPATPVMHNTANAQNPPDTQLAERHSKSKLAIDQIYVRYDTEQTSHTYLFIQMSSKPCIWWLYLDKELYHVHVITPCLDNMLLRQNSSQ